MLVIPSIDIKDGKVVRIFKGDPSKEILSIPSPYDVALGWKEKGAKYFHLVDLNAVFGGQNQTEIIKNIISVGIPCSVGGGIRNIKIAEEYIISGADSIVVSTLIENYTEFLSLVEKFPKKVILALDFDENFRFALRGWEQKSEKKITDIISDVSELPIGGFLFTAVFRDGTGEGVPREHFKHISEFLRSFENRDMKFIASGGITSVDDLNFLKELGFWGAVVGRAFYEGKINVFEI
jgi:phosphoribosylformimino-5-aminoimidazole carboxamide ribotide isomerase